MGNFVKFVTAVARGLIRDQRARRSTMFYVLLAALVLLFVGATWADERLRESPALFLLYWGACAWLTLLAVLLAFFDLLVIRAAARRHRRELAGEVLSAGKAADEDAR